MLALMGLLPWTANVTADKLEFAGRNMLTISSKERRKIIGQDISMIFEEPTSSLNPCFTVGFQIGETLKEHLGLDRSARKQRIIELLDLVGILAPEEPVSALDISIQAQVLNILMDLQEEIHLALVFISHDLSVVRRIADQIMVMYLGKVVEQGEAKIIFDKPAHPYT